VREEGRTEGISWAAAAPTEDGVDLVRVQSAAL